MFGLLPLQVAYTRLEAIARDLEAERQMSDNLLYRMLPVDIADDLRNGKTVEPINYEEVRHVGA
jgi:Heme NO binding associated